MQPMTPTRVKRSSTMSLPLTFPMFKRSLICKQRSFPTVMGNQKPPLKRSTIFLCLPRPVSLKRMRQPNLLQSQWTTTLTQTPERRRMWQALKLLCRPYKHLQQVAYPGRTEGSPAKCATAFSLLKPVSAARKFTFVFGTIHLHRAPPVEPR